MGGGGDDHSGSVFRVGDSVELWRVLAMTSALVLFVMVFERLVHRMEHHLHKYPKYHEMMTKVFGELMILGLIGLGIKILKELAHLDAYSKPMIAFQAADITIFIVAIGLIIQAVVVFLRLRQKNIQADMAELISTQHLMDHTATNRMPTWVDEVASIFASARIQDKRRITNADVPEVATMRILRHYFLRCYGLPELFPFSKYLRQAQDNQISHMIEVDMSTWIILLLIAWGLQGVATGIREHWNENYAIVLAFLAFSWVSVLLNASIAAYFSWAIGELLTAAVEDKTKRANRYLYLNEIAADETQVAEQEMASEAIAVMERVREEEKLKRIKRSRNLLSQHDTGFQLVGTLLRKISSKRARQTGGGAAIEEEGKQVDETQLKSARRREPVKLPWFSRKAWHFVVMSTLMLNAFYFALFCQCVLYQMRELYHEFGAVPTCIIPLPLLINMFVFQPRILRNFIVVSCIVRVDDMALGDVIEHFTATIQLRAEFVQTVNDYLDSSGQTLGDIKAEFESIDVNTSGFLDVEEVRLVLRRFGFKLSFFRFNGVAKLLFDLKGITIEYAQVLKLLDMGQSNEMRALNQSVLASAGIDSAYGSMRFPLQPQSSAKVPPADTSAPYLTPAQPSRPPLLRAKSSAINVLYHFDFDDMRERGTSDAWFSPTSARYVRM